MRAPFAVAVDCPASLRLHRLEAPEELAEVAAVPSAVPSAVVGPSVARLGLVVVARLVAVPVLQLAYGPLPETSCFAVLVALVSWLCSLYVAYLNKTWPLVASLLARAYRWAVPQGLLDFVADSASFHGALQFL